MTQTVLQSPQCVTDNFKHALQERLKDRKNLVYFASGRSIRNGYSDLPYENVVLVDRCFKEVLSVHGKVLCIGLDSVQATALFKQINAKFDAFVCINEGLSEGGGHYPIHGNWSLSNILPILKDEYLHIACPEYYGQRKWKKMSDLPQQAVLLSEKDSGYIDPKMFSDYHKYGKEFCVWKVTKQAGEPVSFKCGNREIAVQRANIWDAYELDALFVRCSPGEAQNLKSVAPRAEILKDHTFEQILRYCNRNKISKLGLSPWLRHNYDGFLTFLEVNEERFPYPQQIHFYHLHKNDFQQLYARAKQHEEC
ncbi:hypothetical protein ACFS7Z_08735 [Pontibacter toksunensis]|uniref:Uncharacterized protein n=1 Tax=Pontibacter toksunensis TaxID=1332631 RepID=A0ABW6BU16_9BACT